ncbi:hypothetical protein EYF80_039192 [Liparis tanakae]|uniref:Uncharacterized protein n=1 Tax=Liparis tanakae TaxID=230148 RepID=A0A4Z2GAP9_9TELE|nr:hypothetical protein EYF80_039192 [Liparis tanakae]
MCCSFGGKSSIQNTQILPEQHAVCSHLAELHQVVLLLMELLHSLVLQKQLLQQPAHLTVCGLKGENIARVRVLSRSSRSLLRLLHSASSLSLWRLALQLAPGLLQLDAALLGSLATLLLLEVHTTERVKAAAVMSVFMPNTIPIKFFRFRFWSGICMVSIGFLKVIREGVAPLMEPSRHHCSSLLSLFWWFQSPPTRNRWLSQLSGGSKAHAHGLISCPRPGLPLFNPACLTLTKSPRLLILTLSNSACCFGTFKIKVLALWKPSKFKLWGLQVNGLLGEPWPLAELWSQGLASLARPLLRCLLPEARARSEDEPSCTLENKKPTEGERIHQNRHMKMKMELEKKKSGG